MMFAQLGVTKILLKMENFNWDTEKDINQGIKLEKYVIKCILKIITDEDDEDDESIIKFKKIIKKKIKKGI